MGRPVQSLIHAANAERFGAYNPAAGMSQVPTELETRLVQACRVLTGGNLSAAQSILEQLRRRGSISEKQDAFARSLCDRAKPATAPAVVSSERQKVNVSNFAAMIDLFDRAAAKKSAKAFSTKVRLVCEDGEIQLSVAGASARFPGTINVATPGAFGEGKWYGRILRDGHFEVSPREKMPADLFDVLGMFARNPLDSMVSYGRKLGRCAICARTLADPVSIDRGIGPICLSRFMGE